jgi:hypothetical protein
MGRLCWLSVTTGKKSSSVAAPDIGPAELVCCLPLRGRRKRLQGTVAG